MTDQEPEQRGPTIRDRRRIDPDTYEVREPQEAAAPAPEAAPVDGDVVDQAAQELAERTADLQRLQAEYVNYKRRVDRDRDVARKVAIENVVKDLLPVLDDLRSAREHDELTGAFKAVGEEVERITSRYGLEAFGEKGDPFDPHIHEALLLSRRGHRRPNLRGDPAAGLPARRPGAASGARGRRGADRRGGGPGVRDGGRGGGGRRARRGAVDRRGMLTAPDLRVAMIDEGRRS